MLSVRRVGLVGVVGAGTMGSSIALHFIMKGLSVCIVDENIESLEKARKSTALFLEEALKKGIISKGKLDYISSNIQFSENLLELASSSLVVEAVFENFDVKQSVYSALEDVVSCDCIIASNTSSFSVSQLASVFRNPARFLGVHYFYHAAKNKLVEIIPGEKTLPVFVDLLKDLYFYLDKFPIVVKGVPGFAINRFFVPWLNEATRLHEEGVANPSFIDKVACEVFGIGLGPFALMNVTGVPIAYHAAKSLGESLGKFYAPSSCLVHQVESGENWVLDEAPEGNKELVTDRLLAAALGVASQMVAEGVASSVDTDLGACLGLRWPIGPIEMIHKKGKVDIQKKVSRLFSTWGMACPELLLGEDAAAVSISYVNTHILGRTGIVEINKPNKMNALDVGLISQIESAFDTLELNESITSIVFMGRGKAFIAGADIKFFLKCIEGEDFEKIYRFTAQGHKLFNRIAVSTKTTFAYVDGLALGGGLEFALCCDYRLATPKASFSFPETGIGIYPGFGGTQRTSRLIGKVNAKYLIATGKHLRAQEAFDIGLIDIIIERRVNLGELVLLCDDFARFMEAFRSIQRPMKTFLLDDDYETKLTLKAPIALDKALSLIDEGSELPLSDALTLELNSIKSIFHTVDAKVGLESVLRREPPIFEGK